MQTNTGRMHLQEAGWLPQCRRIQEECTSKRLGGCHSADEYRKNAPPRGWVAATVQTNTGRMHLQEAGWLPQCRRIQEECTSKRLGGCHSADEYRKNAPPRGWVAATVQTNTGRMHLQEAGWLPQCRRIQEECTSKRLGGCHSADEYIQCKKFRSTVTVYNIVCQLYFGLQWL